MNIKMTDDVSNVHGVCWMFKLKQFLVRQRELNNNKQQQQQQQK